MARFEGAMENRATTVYLVEQFKLAVFTGQVLQSETPEIILNDYSSGEAHTIRPRYNELLKVDGSDTVKNVMPIAIPFNALTEAQLLYCREHSEELHGLSLDAYSSSQTLRVSDECTKYSSSIPLAALDEDVIERINWVVSLKPHIAIK